MDKRYFIVFFTAETYSNNKANGVRTVETKGDKYINADKVLNDIKKDDQRIHSCMLTNIIEINEKDYKEFNKKK